MDDLIEFLLELVFDIGEAAVESKGTPSWLRRLLLWIFGIFAAAVTLGLIILGILTLSQNTLPAVLLLALGLLFLILGLRRLRKYRRTHEAAALDPPTAQKPDRDGTKL